MWIKETQDELKLEKEKGRFSFKQPLVISLITLIARILIYKSGFDKYGGFTPLTWNGIIKKTPDLLIQSLCLALVLYVIQAFFLKRLLLKGSSTSKLCLKCGKILHHSVSKCDCGGELDNLENYKWVD